jgi:hypothetical protein
MISGRAGPYGSRLSQCGHSSYSLYSRISQFGQAHADGVGYIFHELDRASLYLQTRPSCLVIKTRLRACYWLFCPLGLIHTAMTLKSARLQFIRTPSHRKGLIHTFLHQPHHKSILRFHLLLFVPHFGYQMCIIGCWGRWTVLQGCILFCHVVILVALFADDHPCRDHLLFCPFGYGLHLLLPLPHIPPSLEADENSVALRNSDTAKIGPLFPERMEELPEKPCGWTVVSR